jgi:hypothetical protein
MQVKYEPGHDKFEQGALSEDELQALRDTPRSQLTPEQRLALAPPGSTMNKGNQVRYNWDFIRNEFFMGNAFKDPSSGFVYQKYPNITDLAYKYNIDRSYMYSKSYKEGWILQRDAYKTKFREKLDGDNLNNFVTQTAQFDALTISKIKKLFRLIDVYLTRFGPDIFEEENGLYTFTLDNLPEDVTISLKEIKDLAEILDRCQALVRRTVGDGEDKNTIKTLMEEVKQARKNKTSKQDISKLIDKELQSRNAMAKQIEKLKAQQATR